MLGGGVVQWWVGRQLWDRPYSWAQRTTCKPQPGAGQTDQRERPCPQDLPEGKGLLIEAGLALGHLAPEEWGGQTLWGEEQGVVPVKIRWMEVWAGLGEPLWRAEHLLQEGACCLKKTLNLGRLGPVCVECQQSFPLLGGSRAPQAMRVGRAVQRVLGT